MDGSKYSSNRCDIGLDIDIVLPYLGISLFPSFSFLQFYFVSPLEKFYLFFSFFHIQKQNNQPHRLNIIDQRLLQLNPRFDFHLQQGPSCHMIIITGTTAPIVVVG